MLHKETINEKFTFHSRIFEFSRRLTYNIVTQPSYVNKDHEFYELHEFL